MRRDDDEEIQRLQDLEGHIREIAEAFGLLTTEIDFEIVPAKRVLEGMAYGTIGALLGWSITYIILLYLTPNLVDFLESIPLLPVSVLAMLAVLGAQLLLGMIVGVVASLVATRRYGR